MADARAVWVGDSVCGVGVGQGMSMHRRCSRTFSSIGRLDRPAKSIIARCTAKRRPGLPRNWSRVAVSTRARRVATPPLSATRRVRMLSARRRCASGDSWNGSCSSSCSLAWRTSGGSCRYRARSRMPWSSSAGPGAAPAARRLSVLARVCRISVRRCSRSVKTRPASTSSCRACAWLAKLAFSRPPGPGWTPGSAHAGSAVVHSWPQRARRWAGEPCGSSASRDRRSAASCWRSPCASCTWPEADSSRWATSVVQSRVARMGAGGGDRGLSGVLGTLSPPSSLSERGEPSAWRSTLRLEYTRRRGAADARDGAGGAGCASGAELGRLGGVTRRFKSNRSASGRAARGCSRRLARVGAPGATDDGAEPRVASGAAAVVCARARLWDVSERPTERRPGVAVRGGSMEV